MSPEVVGARHHNESDRNAEQSCATAKTRRRLLARRVWMRSVKKLFARASVFCRPGSDLLFRVLRRSTIGAEAFNDRVRDGIGCRHLAIATRPAKDRQSTRFLLQYRWVLKMRTIKPFERLVPVSFTPYSASTPGLSTWSSSTVLKGEMVSRWISRLDAFSGYSVRT